MRRFSRVLGVAAALVCAFPAITAGSAGSARRIEVPREVLAFYYGWYGNPQVSNRWWHWKGVDEAGKRIGNSTNYPRLGAYDSHQPKVIEEHCRMARAAGITGFIVS